MGQILNAMYDRNNDVHDGIACDLITSILELPGMEEAAMKAFYDEFKETSMSWLSQEWGVSDVQNIPFQYIWYKMFNQED